MKLDLSRLTRSRLTRLTVPERRRYQARLAERQYAHSDPENRLVTAELERRWEDALRELKAEEESLAHEEERAPCYAIPTELLEVLADIGPQLPELWEQKLLRTSQKKELLRAMIDRVILHRIAPDQVHVHVRVRVVWRGGAVTEADVAVSVGSFAQLSGAKEMEDAIVRMSRKGQTDEQIAQWLTEQGHRSPQSDVVLPSTVRNVRLAHRILHRTSQSHPRRVSGYLTVPQLADKLGVSRHWIYDRIHNGTIRVSKDASTGSFLFPDKRGTLKQFRQLIDGKLTHLDY